MVFFIPPPAWRRLMVFLIPLPAWTRLMVLIPPPAWRRLTLVQEECYQPGEGKKEREEEWDEEQWRDWEDNLPPPRRYLFRSRQSDLNRLERRDLKRRGLEVPPHLRPKPVTQIESQELKRELRELYKRAKEMQQSMQPGEGMCAKGKGKSRGYMWETERPEPRSPSKPRRRSKSRPKPGEGTCKEEPEKKEPEEGKQKKEKTQAQI